MVSLPSLNTLYNTFARVDFSNQCLIAASLCEIPMIKPSEECKKGSKLNRQTVCKTIQHALLIFVSFYELKKAIATHRGLMGLATTSFIALIAIGSVAMLNQLVGSIQDKSPTSDQDYRLTIKGLLIFWNTLPLFVCLYYKSQNLAVTPKRWIGQLANKLLRKSWIQTLDAIPYPQISWRRALKIATLNLTFMAGAAYNTYNKPSKN